MVEFEYWKLVPQDSLDLAIDVRNELGVHLFHTWNHSDAPAAAGLLRSWVVVPGDLLNDGAHRVDLSAWLGGITRVFHLESVLVFDVHDAMSNLRGPCSDVWPGAMRPHLKWTTEPIDLSSGPAGANR